MNADDLGEKGQSRFQEICVDAKLVCNKSNRDRTGWDYIVEFPFDAEVAALPIDSRRVPLSCHTQVKTVLATTTRITLRLSAAERLAKEIKPTFIYVFRIATDELTFLDSVLIHITGATLARILKRLRKEEAAGNRDRINRKTISIPIDEDGVVLRPTGGAFRDKLRQEIGSNMHEYSTRKEAELKKLGFDALPYGGTFTIGDIADWNDVADIFLGLREKTRIIDFTVYEERFGIRLPTTDSSSKGGTITIKPNPADECTLWVSHPTFAEPAVFQGQLILPGIRVPTQYFKLMVTCDQFALIISAAKKIKFRQAKDLYSEKHTAERWVNLARLYLAFSLGNAEVEFQARSLPGRSRLALTHTSTDLRAERCQRWLDVCEKLAGLLKRAGAPTDFAFLMDEIEQNSEEIHRASEIIEGIPGDLSLIISKHHFIDLAEITQTVWIRYIQFGDHLLAYCAISGLTFQIEGDQSQWKSADVKPGPIRLLRANDDECNAFMEWMKDRTGISTVISAFAPALECEEAA